MKIDSSAIGMESARRYTSVSARSVAFQRRQGTLGATKDGNQQKFSDFLESGEGETLGETALSMRDRMYASNVRPGVASIDEKKAIEEIKAQCLQYLIYWLFGGRGADPFKQQLSRFMNNSAPLQYETVQWTESQYYLEKEDTSFSTQGKVITADGREITFNLDLTMSRRFESYYEANYSATRVMDPLVINLDSNIASLSDQKFEFDLDCDGILDSISMLGKGSGYLALDKNGDGVINDGSELFGTSSGDGFYDLSLYDEDGNGWIDENDEIFSKLLIWTKDENGNDQLYHLKDLGIGAIYLHKVSTDFSLNSLRDNQTNGQIRSTGIFLYENGTAGTMQQLDLAI